MHLIFSGHSQQTFARTNIVHTSCTATGTCLSQEHPAVRMVVPATCSHHRILCRMSCSTPCTGCGRSSPCCAASSGAAYRSRGCQRLLREQECCSGQSTTTFVPPSPELHCYVCATHIRRDIRMQYHRRPVTNASLPSRFMAVKFGTLFVWFNRAGYVSAPSAAYGANYPLGLISRAAETISSIRINVHAGLMWMTSEEQAQ
jgi:hypothetical protein